MRAADIFKIIGGTCVALALFAAAPARAEWLRAESPHFIVYGDVSEGDMRTYVRKIERFDSVLRLYYPVPAARESGKLEIFLGRGIDDLRRISPGLGSGVAGFYTADIDRVFAVVDLSRSEGDSTLFHEYGHHFMLANMAAAYPGWFIEGFAEYYATMDLTPGRIKVGLHSPGRMNSLNVGVNSWVPMETVLGSRTSQLRPGQGFSYYAQAWALTNYLMSTPDNRRKLNLYLRAVMAGADPIEALQGTIDRTPQQLQNDVRNHLYGYKYDTLQQVIPPAEVSISRMSRSARDLVFADLRLDRLGPEGKAEFLSQTRAAAGRHPGDRLAAIVLAKVAIHEEKWAEAEAALASLVDAGTADVDALRLTAVARMKRADVEGVEDAERLALYRSAQGLLTRAVQADPTDYRVYLALADNRQTAPGYPTDNDLNILLAAADYAPQVTTTRFRAARALINEGIYQQAIDLLAPIANNPHGGDGNKPIRDLLEEARSKAGLAATTTAAPPEAEDEAEAP